MSQTKHQHNALIVSTDEQQGWNLLLCTSGTSNEAVSTKSFVYVVAKIKSTQMNVKATKADKIAMLLDDHWKYCRISSDEKEEFSRIAVVFAVAEDEGVENSADVLDQEKQEMVIHLRVESTNMCTTLIKQCSTARAMRFVEQCFDTNIRFMRNQECKKRL